MIKTDTNDRIAYLSQFVTRKRLNLLGDILDKRTRHLTIALEDVYHPHNASAVLRSCDCLGIQDIHIIEDRNTLDISEKVTRGAESWLTLKKYDDPDGRNALRCIEALRQDGYRIIAMTPHHPDYTLGDLEVNEKLAVFFGSEKDGLNDIVLEQADDKVMIPMFGFTESYNISVGVALVLYDLRTKLEATGIDWGLMKQEKQTLMLDWLRYSVRAGKLIEDRFFEGD